MRKNRTITRKFGSVPGVISPSIALLIAIPLCVVSSIEANGIRQKVDAITRMQDLGAEISFDYQWTEDQAWLENAKPPGSVHLKKLFGEHYASNPVEVQLFAGKGMRPEKFTDADAKSISRFSELTWLVLQDSGLTDEGIKHFKRLKKLDRLDIEGTAVTKRRVSELKTALPKVRVYYGPVPFNE